MFRLSSENDVRNRFVYVRLRYFTSCDGFRNKWIDFLIIDSRSHQAGIAETVDYVVKLYDAETQQQLVKNIFVTGGCANLPGFMIGLLLVHFLKRKISEGDILPRHPFHIHLV